MAAPGYSFEDEEHSIRAIQAAFPRSPLWIERKATPARFRQLLIENKFDIVVLSAFVREDGNVIFGTSREQTGSISGDGVAKLLEQADAKLVILASCQSVPLAASLSHRVNMIAATSNLSVVEFEQWVKAFFELLASGKELSESFAIARDSMNLTEAPTSRMVLMYEGAGLYFAKGD